MYVGTGRKSPIRPMESASPLTPSTTPTTRMLPEKCHSLESAMVVSCMCILLHTYKKAILVVVYTVYMKKGLCLDGLDIFSSCSRHQRGSVPGSGQLHASRAVQEGRSPPGHSRPVPRALSRRGRHRHAAQHGELSRCAPGKWTVVVLC